MAQGNVEIVRRIYEEGLFDRDPDRFLDMLATANVEYVNPPEAIEPGIRRGRAEVAQALHSAHKAFDSRRHELRELFDGGDRVVAAVRFHARNRGSESVLVQDEVHTWTLRDGRVTRFEWGRDLAKALSAVGLRS